MDETTTLSNDLLRVAARLSRWANQVAAFDVPSAQARLLALLDERGGMRVSGLARADHSSQPTVTAHVHRLEAAGWVGRADDPTDARASVLFLTADGRAALDRIRAARAAALDPVIARLSGSGRDRVRLAVDVVTELLEHATG